MDSDKFLTVFQYYFSILRIFAFSGIIVLLDDSLIKRLILIVLNGFYLPLILINLTNYTDKLFWVFKSVKIFLFLLIQIMI